MFAENVSQLMHHAMPTAMTEFKLPDSAHSFSKEQSEYSYEADMPLPTTSSTSVAPQHHNIESTLSTKCSENTTMNMV